jgi:hypothetical protein
MEELTITKQKILYSIMIHKLDIGIHFQVQAIYHVYLIIV